MTSHTYPQSAMLGDYCRAAAGFVPTAAIIATAHLGPVALSLFGALAALFLVFGLRTWLHQMTRLEMSEERLRAAGPFGATIPWAELDRLKLAFYSTRRDRRDGWMQLELRAGRANLSFDSRIAGFEALAERAARAAAARGLALSAATVENLQSLGITMSVSALDPETAGGTN
ncbi:MAG TPA: hypothetical protein VM755_16060 [Stellaceae bacterium]|nr:hypothetical protein [Stellaceae bacterium]